MNEGSDVGILLGTYEGSEVGIIDVGTSDIEGPEVGTLVVGTWEGSAVVGV